MSSLKIKTMYLYLLLKMYMMIQDKNGNYCFLIFCASFLDFEKLSGFLKIVIIYKIITRGTQATEQNPEYINTSLSL